MEVTTGPRRCFCFKSQVSWWTPTSSDHWGVGRLTSTKGRVVNFKNTIIIMTSNIGHAFGR